MVSLTLNPVIMIATVINLLIMYWFLKKFLFGKITAFMDNRTSSIEAQLSEAASDKKTANELKLKFENKILTADKEGKKIIEEYKVKASKLSDEMLEDAKKEASLIRERAKIDAQREIDKAKDEMKKQIIAISMLAAAKSVGEQLDEKKHHELINDFINKVEV